MTNDNASVPTADAEQRIDNAVDAIRGMSQDLADEVTPRPGLLDRLSAARHARGAHSLLGDCIPDRCHPGTPMMRSVA